VPIWASAGFGQLVKSERVEKETGKSFSRIMKECKKIYASGGENSKEGGRTGGYHYEGKLDKN